MTDADELTRAVLTAPLWLLPRRCSSRGIAKAIGTSQSRVSRLWRTYPAPSAASAALADLVARRPLTIAGVAVTSAGSHVLLEPVERTPARAYAPVGARTQVRLRALLAAEVLRTGLTVSAAPATAARARGRVAAFWTRAEQAVGRGTAVILTTGTVPAGRIPPDHVLRCAGPREWYGLLQPLSGLPELLVDEPLAEIDQRLRRWYPHPGAPFVWLGASAVSPPTLRTGPMPVARTGVAPVARTGPHAIEADLLREIRSGVRDGSFEIGDDISVRVLADRLGIGRARAQQAIQSLAEEGLVTVAAGRGIAVRLPSISDVLEMYAARRALGSIAVRAASRRRDLDAAELEALVDGLARSIEGGDKVAMQRFDSEFQIALAHASGLSRIPSMLDSFTQQLVMFIDLMGVHYDYPADRMVAQDAALLAGVRAHDQDAAVRAWQDKMDAGATYMLGQVRLLQSSPRDA